MKISKQELIGMSACVGGLKRFKRQTKNTDNRVDVASLIGGFNTYGDLLWLAAKKLEKEKIIKFACDVALINIELIKTHTNKYDLIVEFLKGNVSNTSIFFDLDCISCDYAANAYNAAESALDCYNDCYDCLDVSFSAADAIFFSVSASECKEEINKLLVELFEGEL